MKVNNNGNSGEQFYQDEDNIHENEATQVDIEISIMKNQMLKRVNSFGVTYGIMRKNMKEMQND